MPSTPAYLYFRFYGEYLAGRWSCVRLQNLNRHVLLLLISTFLVNFSDEVFCEFLMRKLEGRFFIISSSTSLGSMLYSASSIVAVYFSMQRSKEWLGRKCEVNNYVNWVMNNCDKRCNCTLYITSVSNSFPNSKSPSFL